MKTTFQKRIERDKLDAVFKDGILIHPLPRVKTAGRERKEWMFIEMAIQKYPYSSIVEAMYNQKIILTL